MRDSADRAFLFARTGGMSGSRDPISQIVPTARYLFVRNVHAVSLESRFGNGRGACPLFAYERRDRPYRMVRFSRWTSAAADGIHSQSSE